MLTGALGAGIFALGAATSAQAANIPVNDAGDSGPGTLRAAINTANNTPLVEDTIKFAIPGNGVHTITPLTPLPTITAPVKINGYTQTDADPATDASPATLRIVFKDGSKRDIRIPVETWMQTGRHTYAIDGGVVAEATVDPDRRLPDADRSNNSVKAR